MALIEWRQGFLSRELAIAAIVALFAGSAIANYFDGSIGLRPIATICVILFTLYMGLAPGLAAAVVATAVHGWLGFFAPWASDASKNPLTTLIFLATNILCAVVAAGLRTGRRQRVRLSELERTRARLEESERRYRTIGEFVPYGVWQADAQGKLRFLSQSFLDMAGVTEHDVLSGEWISRMLPEDVPRYVAAWENKDSASGSWEFEYRIRGVDGAVRTIHARGTRLIGPDGALQGWIGVNRDITDSKRAIDRLSFLSDAGRLLASSLDPETTLDRIAALCVPQVADWCAIDIVQDDGTLKSVAIKHTDPSKIEWARALRARYPALPADDDGPYEVVRTGEPLLFKQIPDALLAQRARDEQHLEMLRRVGMRSAMIVPLVARQRLLGVAMFAQAESERSFDESDLAFMMILCARAGLAYDNARLFAKEQKVAETFQAASLPTELPQLPGIRVTATYRAGRHESEVGGDWYDAFELPDGSLVVSIGDVAGKGLRAAVAMSAVRQILCSAAFEGASPADMLRRCNRVICHRSTGIVTAAIGILVPESRTFTFSSAGHPPVLYADARGDVQQLTTQGIPLGVAAEYSFVERSVVLDENGLIVLYTDGLTEFNRDIRYGEEELARVVRASAGAGVSVPNLADSIVRTTVRGNPPDDIAVLAVELHREAFDTLDIHVPAEASSSRVVRRGLRRLCMAHGLSEDQIFRVLVAAGEAVSNAIEHAYSSDTGSIRVRGHLRNGLLEIEIIDQGQWREGQRREGGRGLDLMRQLMDDVRVSTSPAGTAVHQRMAVGQMPP